MPTLNCPPRETLLGFALGDLPDDKIEVVSDHLESCPECEDTVALFEKQSDTFIGRLQAPVVKSRFADEPEFEDAVAAAKAVACEMDVAQQPASEPQDELLGRVGEYQLLAKLGHGGMGTVYRSLHTRMRRVVALKVLTAHRRHDPAVVERFRREIEATGKLSHPNIVTAHDAGEEDDVHYLVMELVEGVDLHTLVAQYGPLPVDDACEVVRQAALGLQHAHEHGLVHRDLKPSNLMVAVSGRRSAIGSESAAIGDQESESGGGAVTATVKILDLGLARLQGDQVASEHITATGQVMGTVDYMAPEQADDSHAVDIRSDIYALGCTLFKLLAGHAPFSGESYSTIAKKLRGHAEDTPPPIREARPEVPEALADLIARMLAKSPDDRPGTPAVLAGALEPFAVENNLAELAAQVEPPVESRDLAALASEIPALIGGVDGSDDLGKAIARDRKSRRRRPGRFWLWTGLLLMAVSIVCQVSAMIAVFAFVNSATTPEGLAYFLSQSLRPMTFVGLAFMAGVVFVIVGLVQYLLGPPAIEKAPSPTLARWRLWRRVAVGLAVVLMVFLTVVTVSMPDGELVIETNDPGVQIEVRTIGDNTQVAVVDAETGKTVRLLPGKYGVRVVGEDAAYELDRAELTIRRGERVLVKVKQKPTLPRHGNRNDTAAVGEPVEGLILSLTASSSQWKPDDEIELACSYTNDSNEPIYVPRWGAAIPAMDVTRHVNSQVSTDADPAGVVRKHVQLPQEPAIEKGQLAKDTFVEVRPGQTVSVTHRATVDKDGQLTIRWPTGVVQTWSLDNGRFRLQAVLESRDDTLLAKLAREGKLENVWYGKARSGEFDVTVSGVSRAPTDEPEDLEARVDRLIEEADKLLRTYPARGIPALRAELERIGKLADLDPAQRLTLTDKIQSEIDKLQGFADRRTKWKTDVQAAITEAKELAKTDPQAAARRLRSVCGIFSDVVEILYMDHNAFTTDPELYPLSSEYERLARKLDPTGAVKRRLAGESRAVDVRDCLEDAMAEVRVDQNHPQAQTVNGRIKLVQRFFERAQALAGIIDDRQVRAEVSQEIEGAKRQLADSVRWGFGNPVVLDSYDASSQFATGPLEWVFANPGFVLASQRRAGSGPLDLWRSGDPVLGDELLGLRRLGSVPDASGLLMSAMNQDLRVAQPATIDGDTLTLRLWDYDLKDRAARPQVFEVAWQLKPPIQPDRAGSAVIHAHTAHFEEKNGKTIRTLSLFLRLIDKEDPQRSQLLFVRSPDRGKTWPDPPRLVADDVRWPARRLQPICIHPDYAGNDRMAADRLICLAMNEDNKAIFFRTHDGGENWTEERVLLPDPETGKSVPGIPLVSPNPGRTLVYAIPMGDAEDRTYRLCHAWIGYGARSWNSATTISSNRVLSDSQLFSIRATTRDVTAVTCPAPGDGPDGGHVDLLLSIDGPWHRTWRAFRLDDHLGGRVGLTAVRAWRDRRIFVAAEVENPARTENRHQLIVQEISPVALEYAADAEDESQGASDTRSTNSGS